MNEPYNKGKGPGVTWLKAHVNHEGEDCLIWPFSRNEKGYGQASINGKLTKAHRIMCILANGEPPEHRYNAAHSCHNGHLGCVHPKHLSWKTPSENTAESAIHRRGIRMPMRLTIDQVEDIRASNKTHAELAAEYGMATNTIGKIKRWEIWKNPRSALTREQILKIKDLGSSGATAADIARQIGVKSAIVRKTIRSGNYRDIA